MSKKLSDAQINMIINMGVGSGQVGISAKDTRSLKTLDALRNRTVKLVQREMTSNVRYSFWTLTEAGRETLASLTAQPAADEIEAEAPTDATLGDELFSEESAAEPEPVRLTGTITQHSPFGVFVTSDDGKTVKVDRRHIYGLSLGMKVEYQMGKSESPIFDVAQNIKRLIDIAPEPIGPARNADERAAMNTFDPEYDYLEMKPMDTPFVPVIGEHAMFAGLRVKVTARYADGFYRIVYFDEKRNAHSVSRAKGSDLKALYEDVAAVIDPRDAEIEQLKAENAALKAQPLPSGVIAAYTRANAVTRCIYDDMDTYLREWNMALETLYITVGIYIYRSQENK